MEKGGEMRNQTIDIYVLESLISSWENKIEDNKIIEESKLELERGVKNGKQECIRDLEDVVRIFKFKQ